jgi:hypothetical protein
MAQDVEATRLAQVRYDAARTAAERAHLGTEEYAAAARALNDAWRALEAAEAGRPDELAGGEPAPEPAGA